VSGVNRSGAIKKTRIAQIAGLAFVVLTAGAVLYSPKLPDPKNAQTDNLVGDDPTATSEAQNPSDGSYGINPDDSSHVGGILNKIANIEKMAPVAPTNGGGVDDPDPDLPTIPTADGWRYLGGVFEPSINFALVEIDGKQRMLKEGMRLPELDAEVISVEEGRIEITRSGKREEITLAASTGVLVSVSNPKESGALGSSIIAPGQQIDRDVISARQHQILGTDADKRRAEFERHKLERENRLQGNER